VRGRRCPCSPAKRASTRTARVLGRAWYQGLLPGSRRPLAPVPPLVVDLLPFLAQRHVQGAVPVAGLLRSQPAGTLLPHSCRCHELAYGRSFTCRRYHFLTPSGKAWLSGVSSTTRRLRGHSPAPAC